MMPVRIGQRRVAERERAGRGVCGASRQRGERYGRARGRGVADEVAVLHEGRIAQRALPKALLASPASGYVASFVAASLPE